MRRLQPINTNADVVYVACIARLNGQKLDRFASAKTEMMALGNLYISRARFHELYEFPACAHGNDAQVVAGRLTKDDLMGLYSHEMSAERSPGRQYYDCIMLMAPQGICPYCCFGHASTLDHFLSKARYPAFAVLPANLIPSCKDCNGGKVASEITLDQQILHPYYEDITIEADNWLFSEIVEQSPAIVRYVCAPPDHWPDSTRRRLDNFFNSFNLARRFGVQAGPELAVLSLRLEDLATDALRHRYLVDTAAAEIQVRRNSWKSAMYHALAASDWYWRGGFRRPAA